MITSQFNIDKTTYAVSLLHFVPETIHFASVKDELLKLYSQLTEWLESYSALKIQERNEHFLKASQALRGSLTEFLSLPLRSDEENIQKIMTEHFQQFFINTEVNRCLLHGYHYIHHSVSDKLLKPYYNKENDSIRKMLGKKLPGFTLFETWLECSNLDVAIQLQSQISQIIMEKKEKLGFHLLPPLVKIYFLTDTSVTENSANWMRIKLTFRDTLNFFEYAEPIKAAMEDHILHSFRWQSLRTTFLPALNREILYLFDIREKEELHRFRLALAETVHMLKKKKLLKNVSLSISEMECIQETTA